MGIKFSIEAGLIGCVEAGVRSVVAKGYGASWDQAYVFSTVDVLVSRILHFLVRSYYLQNTRQLFLADIAIKATSGLAGVLMTRLFCEKIIKWKQALASSVISEVAIFHARCLLMKPMPLSFFSDIMKQPNPV
jgi:hypothetical protein